MRVTGDIARLLQMLVHRDIGILLAHLRRRSTLLPERITRLTATARTVDAVIERIALMDESAACWD